MTAVDQTVWTCDRCKTFVAERLTSLPTRWRTVEVGYLRSESSDRRADLCGQCAHQLSAFLQGHPLAPVRSENP